MDLVLLWSLAVLAKWVTTSVAMISMTPRLILDDR